MSGTGLQAGDIVFTAYKSDFSSTNGKYFEFVLLESVPAGTQIYLQNSGFRTDTGSFRTNEDIVRWTAQADLPAGTRITFQQEPDGANDASGEWANVSYFGFASNVAGLALNNAGDQIHAFIDPQFSTAQYDSLFATPVASINATGTYAATYDLTGAASQTGLPTGLTVGVSRSPARRFRQREIHRIDRRDAR